MGPLCHRSNTMARTIILFLVLTSLVVLPQVWAQDDSVASDTPSFELKYKLILERNIFSRDRQVYREVVQVERNDPPPPPLEASFVVVGISRLNDMTVAFIEDTSLGEVDQYAVNSQIAMGKILAMTLDSLQYQVSTDVNDVNAVAVTDVKVGQSLLGETASGQPGDSRRTSRSRDEVEPAETSEADEMSDEDMDEVLRRMMEKRQSE
jgi:hypothetical protein